jgi:hypothetical protein
VASVIVIDKDCHVLTLSGSSARCKAVDPESPRVAIMSTS